MRLMKATLHGLWGVYSASGKMEISIDFTKCLHNIVLIIGKNGSGKTTIWEALQPIPLPASKFIDKQPGFVHLEYLYEDTIYNIKIEYPITKSRDRAQTKAFISRITNEGEIELNPNGNLGSYKSTLFSEFNLDPSFVTLSQISQEDMGIVNKKPSERKRYVSAITENIEVYNGIYKSLVKRSGIFKSMINSITAKIDSIGNYENLKTNLTAIDVRIDQLSLQRDELLKNIARLESIISSSDPDGKLQEKFKKLTDRNIELHKLQDMNIIHINKINETYQTTDIEKLLRFTNSKESRQFRINELIESHKSKIKELLVNQQEQTDYVTMKSRRIDSLLADCNIDNIEEEINKVNKQIKQCVDVFTRLGFDETNIITKDEFIVGINVINSIKEQVSIISSIPSSESVLNSAIQNCKFETYEYLKINDKQVEINKASNYITKLHTDIHYYNRLLERTKVLENRPSTCIDDSCAFIHEAVQAAAEEPKRHIEEITKEIEEKTSEFNSLSKEFDYCNEVSEIEHKIIALLRYIENNKAVLNRLPTGHMITDRNEFLSNFTNVLFFNKITELSESLDCANVFEQYKFLCNKLVKLEADYTIYKDRNETIDSINGEISMITNKINNIVSDIEDNQSKIHDLTEENYNLDSEIQTLNNCIQILRTKQSLDKEMESIDIELDTLSTNISIIDSAIDELNSSKSHLMSVNYDLNPLNDERESIRFSLKQLEEYQSELSLYTEKYSVIETIKKYSSPTGGGIQVLFMQLYMGKTISMANELLSTLFDGRMVLEPYIINDTEFRIPCLNKESNVHHDDISSCSSAEKAMISMMIGFSLLYHSSTVYNILRLDEIDGALDQDNRSNFINLLNSFMSKFGIEQCIMISHSSEISMGDVDVIQLVPVSGAQTNGNTIFTY